MYTQPASNTSQTAPRVTADLRRSRGTIPDSVVVKSCATDSRSVSLSSARSDSPLLPMASGRTSSGSEIVLDSSTNPCLAGTIHIFKAVRKETPRPVGGQFGCNLDRRSYGYNNLRPG